MWIKKGNRDKTIGNHDGIKTCELTRTYVLVTLVESINKNDTGLYKDDGLRMMRNCNQLKINEIRKQVFTRMMD